MMLAFLMSEYGMMMTGFVGNARKGWDGVGGVFVVSGGLCEPDFGGFGVPAVVVELDETAVGVIADVRLNFRERETNHIFKSSIQ